MSDSASKAPSSEGQGLSTLVLTPAGERTGAEAPPIVSGAQLGRYVAIETLGPAGWGPSFEPTIRNFGARSRWTLGLIGFLGVGGAAAAYALAEEPEDPCRDVGDRAHGLWDEARRSHLETALRETGLPFADESWRHISKELDQYVERWLAQHRDACEASHAQTQPVDVLALRTSCLDRAQRELSAVLRALEKADAKALEHVGSLLASLPAPAQCGDAQRLAAEFAPPQDPALVPRVDAAMDRLREARAASSPGDRQDCFDAGGSVGVGLGVGG